MERFRVGFIGGGTIANWHAERVRDLGHDVVGIADIEPDARREFADRFDASATYEDYEEMLSHADLDVVVVAVPNVLHADCAVAALEEDLNVFVEKPLAHDLEGAERIAAAARDSEGEVMVGFMKAFEADVETIEALQREGTFGDIYEVNVEYVRQRGIPQIGSWFTRESTAGGGVVIDIGVHMLHLALHLLDFPEIESVSATTGTRFGDREDYTYLSMWGGDPVEDAEFDVEDHARALVTTADGRTIHLNCAWACNTDPRQYVEILGDEAGAKVTPGGDDDLTVYSAKHDAITDERLRSGETDAYAAEWEYFFDVLAGEREHTRNGLEEGLAVQRVIDAIYRSAETGDEVAVAVEEPVAAE
jgi:predicted dehydrogenase